MPTRLIREGILTSPRVDMLDAPAEVFYRRLMSKVDDHGLFDSRPSILRASLFPLKVDRVREADIARWMAACQKAGLIVLYQAEGKSCLKMLDTNWQKRSEPKYPLPPPEDSRLKEADQCPMDGVPEVRVDRSPRSGEMQTVVSNCKQPLTPVYLDVVEGVGEGGGGHTRSQKAVSNATAAKPHTFRESPYFDPFSLAEKLSDWPEERVMQYHEDMLSASDSKGLKYLDWSAVAIQWHLRDLRGREKRR